jgi:hypothetical protein
VPELERLEESRCRAPLDACTLEIPIVGPDRGIEMKGQSKGIDVVWGALSDPPLGLAQ